MYYIAGFLLWVFWFYCAAETSVPLSQLLPIHPKWTLEEAHILLLLPPISRLLTKVQN